MMYQSYIKLPLTSCTIANDNVMFVQLNVTLPLYLNPKTSLACQTMASPRTDMHIRADLLYLKLLLLLHTQYCSTQKSIRQDYSHARQI